MTAFSSSFAVVFAILCAVAGFILSFIYPTNSSRKTTEKAGQGNQESSNADVSRGLKKEEDANSIKTSSSSSSDDKVLSPSVFRQFRVLKILKISHNTKLIRFEISPDKTLGLTIGRHISVRADVDGNKVIRAYTPISKIDQKGYFDLLVKVYEFGKMSSFLHSLKVGSEVDIRGPVGRFQYKSNSFKKIGLIAGGTGITPCLQFIRNILLSPEYMNEDKTGLVLFYQNRTEEDILLYDELQELMKKFPQRLQIIYFLSNPSSASSSLRTSADGGRSDAAYGSLSNERKGYINAEMIEQVMHVEECPFVAICGPSGFNDSMKTLLKNNGNHDLEKTVFVW
jgi:ferredoxin-NADP reductase